MKESYACANKTGTDNRHRTSVRYLFASLVFIFAFVSTSTSSLDIATVPTQLYPYDIATFIIKITNTGETPLDPVEAEDTLPVGLSYVSDNRGGLAQGLNITWRNIGRLEIGASTQIRLVTRIDPGATGWLVNFVTVTGTPPTGYNVTDNDTADLFIRPSCKKMRAVNEESLVVGNQYALAVNPFKDGGSASLAAAENHNDILKTQTLNGCSSNHMKILAGDQSASALYSASAINKRTIRSTQG
jgi:uncharacterized repeat protein (TIGR01451 family)